MLHASYDYPSEIVPFVEVGLALLALLLVFWRPAAIDCRLRALWRRLARIRPRRAVAIAACGGFVLCLASYIPLGFPVPWVADESGNLLIADTLAHGRLANPTPRVPAAFEAVYMIVRPVYTSHRPPAYSTVLAVGQLLGHPGIGVALWVGLLAGACCWFLQGWLPPPWPLVGAALLALRVGVDSYWGQSYWGGSATAVGGMLLYGALPRLWRWGAPRIRRDRFVLAAAIALGLLLLANSRPMEGFVAALPAAAVLAALALSHRRRAARPVLLPVVVAVGAAAALTAAYNRSLTGTPWKLPYQLYRETYGAETPVPFTAPPKPVSYSSPVLEAHLSKRFERPKGVGRAVAIGAKHLSRISWFVCGLPLLGFAVAALQRPRWWKLFALVCVALQAAVHSVTFFWFPHYSAAATGPLILLGVWGMREAAVLRWRGRRPGPWLPFAALLAVQLPLTLVELPRPPPRPRRLDRAARPPRATAPRPQRARPRRRRRPPARRRRMDRQPRRPRPRLHPLDPRSRPRSDPPRRRRLRPASHLACRAGRRSQRRALARAAARANALMAQHRLITSRAHVRCGPPFDHTALALDDGAAGAARGQGRAWRATGR